MASEVGVLDIPPQDVLVKERLHPGKIFLVDTVQGPHRRRRGDQAGAGGAASVPRVARSTISIDINDLPPARAEAARARDRVQAAAGVRLHAGGSALPDRADGRGRRGADRLDGHRHVAGGALGQAAAALRVLQAAVRAGDEPAARRDPRGAGHRHGLDDRAGAQSAQGRARVVPADRDQVPDHPQRARGEAAPSAAELAVPLDDAVDAVRSGAATATGARAGDGRICAAARARRWPPASTS